MNKEKNNCVSAESLRDKILVWLRNNALTTLHARNELDVFHPTARIQELRDIGHQISTHWETIDTGKNKQRVSKYVLYGGRC